MGLDMFLYKKKKNKFFEIANWRKANQIFNWFDDHLDETIDNTSYVPVTKNNLENLIIDCQKVLDNHSLADKILPTVEGFYFGSVEYDEYYYEDIEYTIKQISLQINKINWDKDKIYFYAWW